MSWIFLAAGGQFVNAIVAILDKFIVSDDKLLPRPFVYAFFTCLFTGGWILVYVLGYIPVFSDLGVPNLSNVESPTIQVVGMAFLAAYSFFMALVSMYTALKVASASTVMPVIGAVSATATFVMSYLVLGNTFSVNVIFGISLLVFGTLMVSTMHFRRGVVLHTVHSGIFFALHYIALKGLFDETSFDDGFFWSRIGFVLFALSLLLVPAYWSNIKGQTKNTTRKGGMFVVGTKVLAGIAAFMLLKATDWGDVAVVQALDGLKFVFIVLLGILFGRYIPKTAGENDHSSGAIIKKVLYVSIISIGFVILFI
tara:strand:+ start:1343 stop:2275 length:933 start_codon:yes stop_codon:yes gene_type:complete